jgi:hypothetical protein
MDVAFFPPEAPKHRVETGPGALPATEGTHPLHGYLKRFSLKVAPSRISRPCSPHLAAPFGLEVCGYCLEIVVHNGSLQEIGALRMLPVVLLQPPYHTGSEKDMGITTEDSIAPRLTEH